MAVRFKRKHHSFGRSEEKESEQALRSGGTGPLAKRSAGRFDPDVPRWESVARRCEGICCAASFALPARRSRTTADRASGMVRLETHSTVFEGGSGYDPGTY